MASTQLQEDAGTSPRLRCDVHLVSHSLTQLKGILLDESFYEHRHDTHWA